MKKLVTLFFRLMLDKRVPLKVKILPFIAIAYIVFSRDILPDGLPIIGILDDLIVTAGTMILYFALGSVSRIANGSTKPEPRDKGTRSSSEDTVIDGEFYVVEDEKNQEKE